MKFLAVAAKELTLLRRDRAGLIVLFIMPAILVLAITLVQENVMKLTGQKQPTLLILDQDMGTFGSSLYQRLQSVNSKVSYWKAGEKTVDDLRSVVVQGEFQVAMVIPTGVSTAIQHNVTRGIQNKEQLQATTPITLSLFYDPAIMPTLRNSVTAQLAMVVELVSLQEKVIGLEQKFAHILDGLGAGGGEDTFSQDFVEKFLQQPLVAVQDGGNGSSGKQDMPSYNPVQQNVPAWALFGMFFTAIPLAGSVLQEKHSGIMVRLAASPVSPVSLYMGKVLAYIGICVCQFLLICVIGVYLFPLFGLPAFTITGQVGSIGLVIVCAGMAACGYGAFLGSVCATYEQASTIGATTIVSAAALGGIMVPVYAMPDGMQKVSSWSPLNWGLNAFQELLVRGNGLEVLYPDLVRLILFFVLLSGCSWLASKKRIRS